MIKIESKRLKLIIILTLAAGAGGVLFLVLLHGIHQVESTQFCGYTCHDVMKPQRVAHSFSPHAKVECGTCHIGPGVVHMVQSKIEAMRETWAFVTGRYPKPIISPVKHLRPARFTCEQCHWPEKYYGDKKITKVHYNDDPDNTRQWVTLVMKTGGPGTTSRTGRGIHWHIEQEIDYAFADDRRLTIPWVRVRREGKETIFRSPDFPDSDKLAADSDRVRRMDCMDCHNRATHVLQAPEAWIDEGMESGLFPTDLPNFKHQAAMYLNKTFTSRDEAEKALANIPLFYKTNLPEVFAKRSTEINALPKKLLAGVFDNTQFPEMKTDWFSNPNHLGHTQGGPGCFRCHDGKHATSEGKVISQDCNLCHSRPAFGTGIEPEERMHPILLKGETHQAQACNTCHSPLPSSTGLGLKSVQPPATACFSCHKKEAHPATAPMANLPCGDCHKLHPDSPQGGSCLTCHEGVEKRGMHAQHLEMNLTCAKCHESHTWKPNATTFEKICAGCHNADRPASIDQFNRAKKTP